MGRPKAWLPFGPEAMLQRVVRLCGDVAAERVVVAAAGQELPALPPDVAVVRDAVAGRGPLAGLAAGLAAIRAPAALVVPCDVPLLRPGPPARLFDALGDALAARPVHDGRARPLGAVYRASLAARAAERVATGSLRVRDLVAPGESRDLPDPDGSWLLGCNTPEEYRAALAAAGLPTA
jgi:molybdopterin-guanine dinucleotide biosynthesis protein A